jgi:hypothetical protein
MSHKLVAFTYSLDPVMQEYVQNQLQAVKQAITELNIELSNEQDNRLSLYSTKTGRFPVFMLFDGDIYQTILYGKFDNNFLVSWITNNLR